MDSRQGGSDGVTTDGILAPALPIGVPQIECVWLRYKGESTQMD